MIIRLLYQLHDPLSKLRAFMWTAHHYPFKPTAPVATVKDSSNLETLTFMVNFLMDIQDFRSPLYSLSATYLMYVQRAWDVWSW